MSEGAGLRGSALLGLGSWTLKYMGLKYYDLRYIPYLRDIAVGVYI